MVGGSDTRVDEKQRGKDGEGSEGGGKEGEELERQRNEGMVANQNVVLVLFPQVLYS